MKAMLSFHLCQCERYAFILPINPATAGEGDETMGTAAETKHTPGPWTICEPSDIEIEFGVTRRFMGFQTGSTLICGEKWTGLAQVVTHLEGHKNGEGLANARLIAAAPELLDSERENLTVLENLLAYLRKHEAALPPLSTSSLEVRIDKTRAAIAKAEGR